MADSARTWQQSLLLGREGAYHLWGNRCLIGSIVIRKTSGWDRGHAPRHLLIAVQSVSLVLLFVTPWTAAHQTSHHQLPELAQIHVH